MERFQKPPSPHPEPASALSVGRFVRSFGFALEGIVHVWRSQANFRIEIVIGAAALALGLYLRADLLPVLFMTVIVLSLELLNSAIEAVIDLVSPSYHPLAKCAKDAAAGAVLLASFGALVVGLSVLGPPLWQKVMG